VKINKLIAIVALCSFGRIQAEEKEDLSTWTPVPPPKKGTPEWVIANEDSVEWTVRRNDGEILVVKRSFDSLPIPPLVERMQSMVYWDAVHGKVFVRPTDDGLLIAYDYGEWLGSVWFSSKKNGTVGWKISDDQIKGFVSVGDRLLAISSDPTRHERSRVVKFEKTQAGFWRINTLIELDDMGYAMAQDGAASVLIATDSQLVRVTVEGKKEAVIQSAPWQALYPNSIAINGDYIYIGMRHVICRVGRTSSGEYHALWLKKP
jgi:hypothetical protein